MVETKIQKPRFFWKIFLAVLVVYLGVSLVLHFIRVDKYGYTYKHQNYLELASDIIIQPIVDVGFDRKTSYFYTWSKLDYDSIDKSVLPLVLRSKSYKFTNYNEQISVKNLQRDLGYISESAIVEPKDFSGQWSLVFCSLSENVCQSSNLLHSGEVKILIDGDLELWSQDIQGNFVQLNLVKYLDRHEHKEVLFV